VKFVWVEVEGFRAFGTEVQRIDLSSSLTVLTAENSQGKTSLAEAIEWLVTGCTSRRDLHGGAKAEFIGSLRNVHAPAGCRVRVAARIDLDGSRAVTLERVLTADYQGSTACASILRADGTQVPSVDAVGFPLSRGKLSAPVLLQHVLRYVLSAAPQERADYFKAILELDDLELIRREIKSMRDEFDTAPKHVALSPLGELAVNPTFKDHVGLLRTARSFAEVEAGLLELVNAALILDKHPAATDLSHGVLALRAAVAARHAKVLAVEQLDLGAFDSAREIRSLNLSTYSVSAGAIDREVTRLVPIFEAVLRLPSLPAGGAAVDCPVCGTPRALDPHRVQHLREVLARSGSLRSESQAAIKEVNDLKAAFDHTAQDARRLAPRALRWSEEEEKSNGLAAQNIADAEAALDRLLALARKLPTEATTVADCAEYASKELAKIESDVRALRPVNADAAEYLETLRRGLLTARTALMSSISVYQTHLTELKAMVRAQLDQASGTTGWAQVIELAEAPEIVLEGLLEYYARSAAGKRLDRAAKDIDAGVQKVLDDRFAAMSDEISKWWETIRPDEAVRFHAMARRGTGRRYLDLKGRLKQDDRAPGVVRDAVSVFSDSQLNALGLAAFLARCTLGFAPLIVLDDPIPGSDSEHRYTFAAGTVRGLLDAGLQIIVTTFDANLSRQLHSLYQDRNIAEYNAVLIDAAQGTTITSSTDRFDYLMAAAKDQMNSAVEENRNIAGVYLRRAAERLSKSIIVAGRRASSDANASIADYDGRNLDKLHPDVSQYAIKSNEPGLWRALARELNEAAHDAPTAPPRQTLKQCHGDLTVLRKLHPEAASAS
jgi:hypothetical protein